MKKFLKSVLFVSIFYCLCAASAAAYDIDLEKIVVTPSRIEESAGASGRSTDVISEEDLRFMNPPDIASALKERTGVYIGDYGALGALKSASMRGSTSSQVLVLIDGRPANSPRSGGVDLATIPLDNVERIEVLRGPASSLYGSTAMGGVINVITKDAPREGQETEFSSRFGTFRTYQEQLSHGARIKNFGYRINSGYQSSEGHRDNSAFNAKDFSAKISYDLRPGNALTFGGGFYKDILGTPGFITSPDLNDKQSNAKKFFDLKWELELNEEENRETGISARLYQTDERLDFIETPSPLDKTTHRTISRGLNIQGNRRLSTWYRFIGGLDWTDHHNDSTITAKHRYEVWAGFLENELTPREDFKINLGIRVDDYSNFGSEASPSLNLLYRPEGGWSFRFLIANSFRAPTFNDLYWPSADGAEGNPNLVPEKGTSGEFGIEKKISGFCRIGLTYFRHDYSNLIKWQEDSDGIFRPKNVDSAVIDGIEQNIEITFFRRLDMAVYYTYLAAIDDKAKKDLTYQPNNRAQFSLTYNGANGLKAGFRALFVGKIFHDPANNVILKRYSTLGITVAKDLQENVNVFFDIDNFLNKTYQTRRRYPLPGLSVRSGIKLKF